MRLLSQMSFLLVLFWLALSQVQAQKIKRPKLELDVDNPIVQTFLKKVLQEGIPKATGKSEKIQDISFLSRRQQDGIIDLKGRIIFQNPKAALGNGDYRFKLKMNSNLLQPKVHHLRLQTFRFWFIRFYKRVI